MGATSEKTAAQQHLLRICGVGSKHGEGPWHDSDWRPKWTHTHKHKHTGGMLMRASPEILLTKVLFVDISGFPQIFTVFYSHPLSKKLTSICLEQQNTRGGAPSPPPPASSPPLPAEARVCWKPQLPLALCGGHCNAGNRSTAQ